MMNLKNILYEGTEVRWSLSAGKALIADKVIVFDYMPEA